MFWKKFLKKASDVLCFFSSFFLYVYQIFLSGTLSMGGCCRFYPSCSDYALSAYKRFSFVRATSLVFKRILRCRPFNSSLSLKEEFWFFEEAGNATTKK